MSEVNFIVLFNKMAVINDELHIPKYLSNDFFYSHTIKEQ